MYLVVGGFKTATYLSSTETLIASASSWNFVASLPVKANGLRAVSNNNFILTFGNFYLCIIVHLKACRKLSVPKTTKRWSHFHSIVKLPILSCPVPSHPCPVPIPSLFCPCPSPVQASERDRHYNPFLDQLPTTTTTKLLKDCRTTIMKDSLGLRPQKGTETIITFWTTHPPPNTTKLLKDCRIGHVNFFFFDQRQLF